MFTTLSRFPKFGTVDQFRNELDSMIKGMDLLKPELFYVTKVDDNTTKLEVSVVGHDPKDVEVEVTDTEIKVSASKKETASFLVNSINLDFELPKDVDGSKTEATISNGILTLLLHKRTEKESKKLKIRF